jgi:hypothetical protein
MPVVNILGEDDVHPQIAQVLRDDQTIIWRLNPGLAWDPAAGDHAVKFSDETEVYSPWPGKPAEPVGPTPEPGSYDTRDYTATADRLMDPRQFVFYHYEIATIDMITGQSVSMRVRKFNEWYDPEVVNEPRP